jgi:hypothetical protein
MNRCWMLGTLLFGSMIALGRNIRLTMVDGVNSHGILEGIIFGAGAPVNEGRKLRRILQESSIPLYQFVYFEEQSLSRERHLYRGMEDEVMTPVEELLKQANDVLTAGTTTQISKYNMHPNAATVAVIQQNTTLLGLAYFLTGSDDYADQAVEMIRHHFVNPKTALSPDDLYDSPLHGQVYQLLDAMQMVQGFLYDHELPQLREWFTNYLQHFEQVGKSDRESKNHSGLYYDIENMAVSHFVRDESRMAQIWKRAQERLSQQISSNGNFLPELIQKGSPQCEHNQLYMLQGWWTLSRLFSNAMGESLWTAEKEALCRASLYSIPYLQLRDQCDGGASAVPRDDRRWWPLVVDTQRHCIDAEGKTLRWREWMSIDSKEVPSNLYEMPRAFAGDTGIPPFWNLGLKMKKTGPDSGEMSAAGAAANQDVATGRVTKTSSIHIPAKLLKASEQDAEIRQRLSRIKRWHELGQVNIAERMMKKALKDLRSTRVVWQPKDIMPQAMLDAAKTDPLMDERVSRIRRWHALKQTSIVERMIKKSMDELVISAEDQAAVAAIAKQAKDLNRPMSFLRAQQDGDTAGRETQQDTSTSNIATTTDGDDEHKSLFNKMINLATTLSEKAASMQIPPSLVQQAQTDGELAKRIHRIHRWKKLGQHEIADKMIKKLLASTEDQTF